MLVHKLPSTVEQLDSWLKNRFQVIPGIDRAYLEFPFELKANGQSIYTAHRIRFISLALRGKAALCCRQIAQAFLTATAAEHETILDRSLMLFIRSAPELVKENGASAVYMRAAFYDNRLNELLLQQPCVKLEGRVPNDAILPEEE